MRLSKRIAKISELFERQEQAGQQEKNRLHKATRNGAWLSAVPHRLNGTELSREEFRGNLRLRYRLMPQDIPATCDGCGKKFSIEHALSCPKGGLVLVRHDGTAKEWVALGARALVPIAITYEPKINSRTVQRERTGDPRAPHSFTASSCRARIRPPFGNDRACSIKKFLPQPSQVAGMS